ncbi:predicted protein [Plenodomus lingam JN3]|uniref:Predicted protein n=1 Tax=Leptosphaeria maculans (strain JN3 / isolate v23.1.3 / race Av1-4-5-6-7-8) TaxID=985895 RepID=E5R4I6_LEPMJ|nr:predicted protein [Plenodomus lingam JN3]CBX91954.1 predicted protein [Plenodomus lingam JN3]
MTPPPPQTHIIDTLAASRPSSTPHAASTSKNTITSSCTVGLGVVVRLRCGRWWRRGLGG